MSKIIKIMGSIILAGVVIGAIAIVVPKLSAKNTATTAGTLTSARATNENALPGGQDLLAVLQNVNSINLKDSILKDPAFQSLTDISLSIQRTNTEGRVNPFADLKTFTPVAATNILAAPSTTIPATQ